MMKYFKISYLTGTGISFFVFITILFSCSPEKETTINWQKVFVNDSNGQSLFGDKSKLIEAVRLGYPVRIGWGGSRVEHVTDATFLTIFQGKEVFAQINPIVGQEPRIENDSLKIRFRRGHQWVKMTGTNGYSTSFMDNTTSNPNPNGPSERYNSTTWYVLYPKHQIDIVAVPLWRKESKNWEIWSNTKKQESNTSRF